MLKIQMIRSFEYDYLSRLMREAGGIVTRAPKVAGSDRREFGKLLKNYGPPRQLCRQIG